MISQIFIKFRSFYSKNKSKKSLHIKKFIYNLKYLLKLENIQYFKVFLIFFQKFFIKANIGIKVRELIIY